MFKLLIDAIQLQNRPSAAGWLIFDVRHDLVDHHAGRRAFELGHIPGAVFLDHERQLSAPKTGCNGRHPLPEISKFAALMQARGLTRESQVVVYDANSGMFAAHLWWMLRWLGHDKVAILDGGWQAWLDAGGDVETGRVEEAVTDWPAGAPVYNGPSMPLVDASAVLANLDAATPSFTLLDARASNRFRGDIEPLDPVAGHIPGALNRPSNLNVTDNGRFKTAAELRAEFNALLGQRPAAGIVHQCGSGISACHNLFAMELAGLKGSALYHNSWSEWCSDPARPVATGS